MAKNSLTWLISLTILYGFPSQAQEQNMQISIKINNEKIITATLEHNKTTLDFIALLPLTLELEDYNKTEKISSLPKKLTKEGAPIAMTPKTGNIAYYAPWGNLAIFYRDFSQSPGLIKLGSIDTNIEALNLPDPITVTIEMLRQPTK